MARSERERTVLIAEDDESTRQLLATTMELEGWQVVHAVDGRQAIDHLLVDPPDLVILDMMMPRVKGLEVLQAMQANTRLLRVPVIVCSAREGALERDAAQLLGASTWLVKPVEVSALLAAVADATG